MIPDGQFAYHVAEMLFTEFHRQQRDVRFCDESTFAREGYDLHGACSHTVTLCQSTLIDRLPGNSTTNSSVATDFHIDVKPTIRRSNATRLFPRYLLGAQCSGRGLRASTAFGLPSSMPPYTYPTYQEYKTMSLMEFHGSPPPCLHCLSAVAIGKCL